MSQICHKIFVMAVLNMMNKFKFILKKIILFINISKFCVTKIQCFSAGKINILLCRYNCRKKKEIIPHVSPSK